MTNEEREDAINFFKEVARREVGVYSKLAIEALEQQPCEDCISRQAVRDFIKRLQRWCVRSEDGKFNNVGLLYDDVAFGIDKLPSVTPKKKTGWYIAHGMYEDRFRCSCGFTKIMDTNMIEWKQCPICGGTRIMESEDEG